MSLLLLHRKYKLCFPLKKKKDSVVQFLHCFGFNMGFNLINCNRCLYLGNTCYSSATLYVNVGLGIFYFCASNTDFHFRYDGLSFLVLLLQKLIAHLCLCGNRLVSWAAKYTSVLVLKACLLISVLLGFAFAKELTKSDGGIIAYLTHFDM